MNIVKVLSIDCLDRLRGWPGRGPPLWAQTVARISVCSRPGYRIGSRGGDVGDGTGADCGRVLRESVSSFNNLLLGAEVCELSLSFFANLASLNTFL